MPHVSRIVGYLLISPIACTTTPADPGGTEQPDGGGGSGGSGGADAAACSAHQAVAEGLERLARRKAGSKRLFKLRSASDLLPAIDEARARLRACLASAGASGGVGAQPAVEQAPLEEEDLSRADLEILEPPQDAEDAAFDPDAARPPTQPIRVKFLDGQSEGITRVMQEADEWTKCEGTGLQFQYYDSAGQPLSGNAAAATEFDVRVTFLDRGYWSYVGKDVPTTVTALQPTMGLTGLDKPGVSADKWSHTVLHEFGHALGLLHEHLRDVVVKCIDENEAIKYYGRPPNSWAPEKTRKNLLTPLASRIVRSAEYDYKSVMNYRLPLQILKDGACKDIQLPDLATKPSARDCAMIAYYYPAASAIQAPPSAQSSMPFETVVYPESFRRGERLYYKWTIKPRAAEIARIDTVTYDMEPYFRVQTVDRANGFAVTRATWGTFPIKITVTYSGGGRQQYMYYPELGPAVSVKPGADGSGAPRPGARRPRSG